MKKNLFLISVVALALGACSNDTTLEQNTATELQPAEIAFSPLAQPNTRAASATTPAIDGATYPDDLTMQVAAYAMPISSSWAAGGYFDKTPFNGTNALNWKGTPSRYWPLSDAYVTFLAVAGVEAGDVSFAASTYASGATVTYDGDSFTAQTDLLYSGKQASVTKSGNALTFPGPVGMTFKHALAWLQFNVRAASDAYDEKFAITKIEIVDANKTGTFTITNTGYDTSGDPTPTGVWDGFAAGANYDVPSSAIAAGSLTTAFQACGNALLVPKPAAASFTKFVIYYTLDGKAFTFDYTPETTTLAQATKYVYNITFTLTEILIDPVVTEWTDGGSEYIDVPATSFAAPTGGTYNVEAAAGTYTIYVTGLGTSDTVSAEETGGSDYIDGDITATNTAGVAKIVFKMKANASSSRSTTITLTDSTDGTKTTAITISQAAGS